MILRKPYKTYNNNVKNKNDFNTNLRFINILLIKIVREELVDYFAANLLVPANRFLPLDLKTDRELASIFHVNERCIKKRRREIENELSFQYPYREYTVKNMLSVTRGTVIGLGIFKVTCKTAGYSYNKFLSFVTIKHSDEAYISTCINLRIDGNGRTGQNAERYMFENVLFFLRQNYKLLSPEDAVKNLESLYEADEISDELWNAYNGLLEQIPVNQQKRPFQNPDRNAVYANDTSVNESRYPKGCRILFNISLKGKT